MSHTTTDLASTPTTWAATHTEANLSPAQHPPTTEMWLYGSVARGTHHNGSDLDILIVGDDHKMSPVMLAQATHALPQREHLAVRHYSWDQFKGMSRYGSLFLLHLQLEGKRLHPAADSSLVEDLLAALPPYQLRDRDLEGFAQALDDVEWSLLNEPDITFELGVLATILRHSSILACYLVGQPLFDYTRSIPHAFDAVGMNGHADQAVQLYDFRLHSARGAPLSQTPSMALATDWVAMARTFLRKVKDL